MKPVDTGMDDAPVSGFSRGDRFQTRSFRCFISNNNLIQKIATHHQTQISILFIAKSSLTLAWAQVWAGCSSLP